MSIAIRRLRGTAKNNVNFGAFSLGLVSGLVGYCNYRIKIKKEFLVGHGLSRLGQMSKNMTPYSAQWLGFYRMPDKEYAMWHLFKPYFVIGQIDYAKEVLIPKTKVVNGVKHHGFDVVNPLYCYDAGKMHLEALPMGQEQNILRSDRAAIIVNRGWIPYSMKDKKTRPWEQNSRQLVKVKGTFRMAKDVHDYKVPNNPNNNEWHNLAPNDLARYWELANFNELSQFYFQAVDLHGQGGSNLGTSGKSYKFPIFPSNEEIVREYYSWWTHENTNKLFYYTLTPVAAVSWALFFLTI